MLLLLQASVCEGKRESITTDLILKLLALDVCSETPIGNQMIRGVSGGQRKRVTTGEMMVGPKSVLLMDEVGDVHFQLNPSSCWSFDSKLACQSTGQRELWGSAEALTYRPHLLFDDTL